MGENLKAMMSVDDVHKETGWSKPYILELLNSADTFGFKAGRKWIIPRASFEAWAARRVQEKRSDAV